MELRQALEHKALALSAARRAASSHLRVAVEGCLAELAMGQSRFDVRIGWEAQARGAGSDSGALAALTVGGAAEDVGARLACDILRFIRETR